MADPIWSTPLRKSFFESKFSKASFKFCFFSTRVVKIELPTDSSDPEILFVILVRTPSGLGNVSSDPVNEESPEVSKDPDILAVKEAVALPMFSNVSWDAAKSKK